SEESAQTALIPPFGGIVGDFGGATFRVSLVRRSPFQASFRPMPEPILRVHPLCRERNSRNRRIRAKTAFKRIPTVRRTNLKGQLRSRRANSDRLKRAESGPMGSPREGPECAPKPSFPCERE